MLLVLADRLDMRDALTSTVRDALLRMATHTSSEKGRLAVPLITNNSSISPFPMSVVVNVGGQEIV
jgi:autophagy-related protein 101